jgi:hypothetical protein
MAAAARVNSYSNITVYTVSIPGLRPDPVYYSPVGRWLTRGVVFRLHKLSVNIQLSHSSLK